jgi:hypothetical protein
MVDSPGKKLVRRDEVVGDPRRMGEVLAVGARGSHPEGMSHAG